MYSLPSTASLACVSGDGQSLKRPASFPTAEHVLVNASLTRSGVLGVEKSAPPRELAWNVEDDLSQGSERYLLPPRDGQEESALIIHVGTSVTGSNRSSRLLRQDETLERTARQSSKAVHPLPTRSGKHLLVSITASMPAIETVRNSKSPRLELRTCLCCSSSSFPKQAHLSKPVHQLVPTGLQKGCIAVL